MLSYQDTVNQDLTERSLAIIDGLEDNEELNALIQERFMSYPTSFSRNFLSDNLLYNSDKFANCAETAPKGGVFYGANAEPRSIKNEDFVDISRLLYDSSDESALPANQIAGDIDIDLFDHRKGVDNNQFIYKNNNNNNGIDTIKNEYTRLNCVKSVSDRDGFNSGFQSASTSTSPSPTNVLSMNSPKHDSYYLMQATDISPESTIDSAHFLNDPFNYETMLGDDRLLFYTPDNSCGPIDITDSKNKKPMLTLLNLKGTFVNDDEINTPNIIDTIMEASEQPLFLKENDIFDEVSLPSTSLQELTPCPSTSSPAAVSDTTVDVDGFLSAVTSPITSPPPVRRPGRPRKRRHDSDYETPEDDDDDEYIPPTHQRRKYKDSPRIAKKKFVYEDISADENDDSQSARRQKDIDNRLKSTSAIEDELLRITKRGRPPKHTRSISSDDYSCLDPSEARYREMRDRNNEASRKSRYKRKQKEILMTDELEDLEMDNIKLKAQVEELQKTVDRYRDNLMKVMLSGKK